MVKLVKKVKNMRCKKCFKTVQTNAMRRAMCWNEWQLCGNCAVIAHPDRYCSRTRGIVDGKGYNYKEKKR
jgi:hypothetical protein